MARRLPVLLLILAGCGGTTPPPDSNGGAGGAPASDPQPLERDGLHNLFRVGERLYSGSSPDGDAGFGSLRRLGVRTVISVDGAKPDVTTADRHGLRYVHLPVGYDGIPARQALLLAKAVRDLPGPVYLHCHHGKHRGPAACAAVMLSLDPTWSPERGERWLTAAGTDSKYSGLLQVPRTLRRPTQAELDALAPDFPTTARVPALVRLMVDVDARWDHLKAVKDAGWLPPSDHPDLDPAHEAVLLQEHYREAARMGEVTGQGKEIVALFAEGEAAAKALEQAVRAKDSTGAIVAFSRSQTACTRCHERFRDRK